MSESTEAVSKLKKAANYAKLAMRKDGPRSFKRGQGALLKVIYKFGEGTLGKDEAKKVLGWRGGDVRAVAKKAADNGYLTIADPKEGFTMALTPMGTEVVKKRLAAEDKAADELLSALSADEKAQLIALCEKVSQQAEAMGADYSRIQRRHGRHCGERCCQGHGSKDRQGKGKGHGHGSTHCHHGHGAPKYVFVFEDGQDHHHHPECEGGHHGKRHGKKH